MENNYDINMFYVNLILVLRISTSNVFLEIIIMERPEMINKFDKNAAVDKPLKFIILKSRNYIQCQSINNKSG